MLLTAYIYISRFTGMESVRLSPQTLLALHRFSQQPTAWLYGYQLIRETGLKSGTLYPILARLAKRRMLEARWARTEEGVPLRHTYRPTPKGLELARIGSRGDSTRERGGVHSPCGIRICTERAE